MPSWIEIEPVLGMIGIYAILALSLNVICGMTGLLQIGHAGFYAVGAYTAGLIAIYATQPELGAANLLIGAAAAMVMAGLFSLLIGIPCLRLHGDYLAIATLGFGEIVRLLLNNIQFPGGAMFPDEIIGGNTGIYFTEFPEEVWPGIPWIVENGYDAGYAKLWVIWFCVAVTFVLLLNFKRSAMGRAMMCIREDEVAAKAMGIHVPAYKMRAFFISAAFAGLAGALFFHKEQQIEPGSFNLLLSIEVLLMVVLGGLGSLTGSLCGAVLLGILPQALRHVDLSGMTWLPEVMQKPLSEYNQLIYAILLIVLIRIMPNGILGMNELPSWCRGRKRGAADG